MPIRATVRPMPNPGHAILRLSEFDASPDGLTLSIQRQQGPDFHLADDGWRRTEAWLLPGHVERIGTMLEFHLGPEICDHLAGIATVRLRVKEPDIGVVGTTVLAWPNMLTSGALGSSGATDDTVRLRRASPPELPPKPEPIPEPLPDLKAVRDPELAAMERRTGVPTWVMAMLAAIALTGVGIYAYTRLGPRDEPQVAAVPTPTPLPAPAALPAKSIRDTVVEYLATKPTPEAMLAKGQEFAKAGQMNGAFLVWRRAAEAGNPAAQVELARFYDPLGQQPKADFSPDGTRAADWYERAALAGSADAQRRLGLLFAKGGGGLNADPAKARTWLEQAAAQNDADAKKALAALPK